jgi:hypothetical protein
MEDQIKEGLQLHEESEAERKRQEDIASARAKSEIYVRKQQDPMGEKLVKKIGDNLKSLYYWDNNRNSYWVYSELEGNNLDSLTQDIHLLEINESEREEAREQLAMHSKIDPETDRSDILRQAIRNKLNQLREELVSPSQS